MDEIRMPLDSHVEEVKANIFLGKNLIDDVLRIILQAFLQYFTE